MKVQLSNSIIDVKRTTQAICATTDGIKIIEILDSSTFEIFRIYPLSDEDQKNDFKKLVKAIRSLCDKTLKAIEKEQETNKKD